MAESNSNNRIALLFAIGAILVAGGAVYGIITVLNNYNTIERETSRPIETVTVVAASRTLYQGVGITNDDLFVVNVPPEYLPIRKDLESEEVTKVETFSSRERVVGQVPRERILANEFIRPERLADGASGVGLNAVIPRGMRAISVGIAGADAVSGFLTPGNYVDVLVTMVDEFGDPRTETILQAVFVLGVNSRAQNERDEDVAARGGQGPSVTFLVTPKQAEDIAYAAEVGALSLTLRNVQDVNYKLLSGADLDTLLYRVSPKAEPVAVIEEPVRRPRPRVATPKNDPTVITIYKGTNKSTVTSPD